MTTMVLQEFLRSGGTHEDLFAKYAVKAKRHPKHPNLVLFKYDQVASPFHEPIVRECRGVILDESDDYRVVSRAFDKFFNHGEGHAAEVNWQTARVQEKLDGSLCVLYPYGGQWHVATSSTPDASGGVNDFGFTFAELFWKTLDLGLLADLATRLKNVRVCFSFELTSQYNRVVVQHERPSLTLLGARDLDTMREMFADQACELLGLKVSCVRHISLKSFAEVAKVIAETSDPLKQEGFVVVDHQFHRVKVKDPAYVAIHHARDGMSKRALLDIARSGEVPEVIAAFPELKPILEQCKVDFEALVTDVERDYEKLKGIETQKEFALAAKSSRCSGALFAVRKGVSPSACEFLRTMRVDAVMVLLGYKEKAQVEGES